VVLLVLWWGWGVGVHYMEDQDMVGEGGLVNLVLVNLVLYYVF
jgi:hypothetical protein